MLKQEKYWEAKNRSMQERVATAIQHILRTRKQRQCAQTKLPCPRALHVRLDRTRIISHHNFLDLKHSIAAWRPDALLTISIPTRTYQSALQPSKSRPPVK